MAKLTYQARKKLSGNVFAVDHQKRKYPIDTKARARNALARVSQFGTPAEKAKVRAAVKRKYPDIEQSK